MLSRRHSRIRKKIWRIWYDGMKLPILRSSGHSWNESWTPHISWICISSRNQDFWELKNRSSGSKNIKPNTLALDSERKLWELSQMLYVAACQHTLFFSADSNSQCSRHRPYFHRKVWSKSPLSLLLRSFHVQYSTSCVGAAPHAH